MGWGLEGGGGGGVGEGYKCGQNSFREASTNNEVSAPSLQKSLIQPQCVYFIFYALQ